MGNCALPGRELLVGLLLMAAAKLGGNAEVVGGDEAGRRDASGKAGTDVGSSSEGGLAHRARGEAEESGGSHLSGERRAIEMGIGAWSGVLPQ